MGLGVLAVTAAFLTWKHAGWGTFFEFATNRANSAELGAWARAWRHAALWADLNFRWTAVPVVLGLLAVVGTARCRHPFWLACAAYFAASFVAFARHSYFLDRLQLAAGLVFVVLAAVGLAELLARLDAARPGSARPLGGLAVAAAAAVTLAGGPAFDRQHDLLFPPLNQSLAEVSTAVRRIMADHDAAIVVGTFNNFSAPWTRILWHESRGGRPRTGLVTEFDYPLPPSRSGLDPAWDPRYARHLEERLKVIDAPVAITLEPYPDAPWRDGDYRHWNEWKRNYVTALRAHPDVHLVEEIDLPRAQLTVGVHRIGGGRVRYAEGWSGPEGWGRWCTAARAVVEIPVSRSPSVCVIRAAAWGGLPEAQRCRVLHADTLLAEFTVEPVPWRFADYEVPIGPQRAARIPLTLEFVGLWPAGPGDPRQLALAVQDVFVR